MVDQRQPEPAIIGGKRSHDVLRKVLAQQKPCKVLDAPCGTGSLTQFLMDRGWEVHAADIDSGLLRIKDVRFTRVDLNRGIDFPDNAFDAVVCANGLHRLFNPGGAVREFYRVLQPGGRLYITVNNYASIEKRLRFLVYGSITNTINEGSFQQTIDAPEAHVRHHLFYPQLANALEAAGFEISSVRASSRKLKHTLLSPVAWLLRGATWLISPKARRRNRIAETRSAAVLPGGKYIFVEARKPGGGAA